MCFYFGIETCGSGINITRVGSTKRIDNETVTFSFNSGSENIWGAGINIMFYT